MRKKKITSREQNIIKDKELNVGDKKKQININWSMLYFEPSL